MKKLWILALIFFLVQNPTEGANPDKTIIEGHVIDQNGLHIPFATISIKGTTIGTTVDQDGHFTLNHIPTGKLVLKAQYLGYKPQEIQVHIKAGETKKIQFKLEEDLLHLEEVVVTANRNEINRKEATSVVNSLSKKLFIATESNSLSDGLNFCSGLRMENNCQNCGFSQVRINGMEGPYSQILINNRPIFSGLAGVYGLELFPSNMIERIEVIRGGGSALYGSNAIAGTINIILKDPISNVYEASATYGILGLGINNNGLAQDISTNLNASLVSKDHKSGLSIYGAHRLRDPFDANGDGFSETTSINNTTLGTRIYQRFGFRSKISLDFFNIKENRRGGNKFDQLPHLADIAETVDHDITTGAITFDQFLRENDLLSVFLSGQKVNRDSYYGALQSLKDYGFTEDFSYASGVQYNAILKKGTLVMGIEDQGAWLTDIKHGYPNIENYEIDFSDTTLSIPLEEGRIIADQKSHTFSTFAQYDIKLKKTSISAGLRYSYFQVIDQKENGDETSGNVFSPRIAIKYNFLENFQGRISYSQGFRAPQIFDEDLHIETSGARKVIHENADDLVEEKSHSFMLSADYNEQIGQSKINLLIEGFYTRLNNAFINEYGIPDESGTVVYTRTNAEKGAAVQGLNIEFDLVPKKNFNLKGGFTIQKSAYEEVHEFNEKRFFRTPNDYGFVTIDWRLTKKIAISGTANYTGKMLIPYFGVDASNPAIGELRESNRFLDMATKIRYTVNVSEVKLQIYAGIKNIFNAYQSDFDFGINRDPGYTYGPMNPRYIYVGIKIGPGLL